jgi:MbtH protein
MSIDNENTLFLVVINDQQQYSIWPAFKDVPNGWEETGKRDVKARCLEYINEHWLDMRPKELRDALSS